MTDERGGESALAELVTMLDDKAPVQRRQAAHEALDRLNEARPVPEPSADG